MTEQEIKKMKASVKRNVERTFVESGWKCRGGSFYNCDVYGIRGDIVQVRVIVEFNCKIMTVTAKLDTQAEYGVADSIKTFGSDEAIQDCIDWVAEKVIETYDIVKSRVSPYKEACEKYQETYDKYQRALRGEL